jgi:acetylornithine deacetylase/succinyl-diaminopimelate desuccinylase-like protein
MSAGYTDSRWLRNAGIPSYGVSGLFVDPVHSGVHGLNEQVGVKQLYDSKEFLYRLVKRLAAPSSACSGEVDAGSPTRTCANKSSARQ